MGIYKAIAFIRSRRHFRKFRDKIGQKKLSPYFIRIEIKILTELQKPGFTVTLAKSKKKYGEEFHLLPSLSDVKLKSNFNSTF